MNGKVGFFSSVFQSDVLFALQSFGLLYTIEHLDEVISLVSSGSCLIRTTLSSCTYELQGPP